MYGYIFKFKNVCRGTLALPGFPVLLLQKQHRHPWLGTFQSLCFGEHICAHLRAFFSLSEGGAASALFGTFLFSPDYASWKIPNHHRDLCCYFFLATISHYLDLV